MPVRIVEATADGGRLALGRTLPSLLDEAVRSNANPRALNQRVGDAWHPTSTQTLQVQARSMAVGLRASGLVAGDRVAFFTESDVSFVVGDLACLTGGLVTVPIYLTESAHNVRHILQESGARAALCSTPELLARFADLLHGSAVEFVALFQGGDAGAALPQEPAGVRVTTYAELQRLGEARGISEGEALAAEVDALDLATILYTSGTTGTPKGVMLSHQNISSNIIACLTALPSFRRGPDEVVLSFLPLTHIFARTLQYGMMWYGASVYFGEPANVARDLREVKPTFFATVPRVLEKAFDRIMAVGSELSGVKRTLFDAALAHGRSYDPERPPRGAAALRHAVFDRLVYARWREALGGNVRIVIVGGAALRAELTRSFCAAGLDVLQGYGLTETSPVMTFCRVDHNRPGTVGAAIAGTAFGFTEEGEILARGPHVMLGYYKQPELTAAVLGADGWFRTGDLGTADDDGLLRVTGRLKYLFKLTTGKYVMPQPLEERIDASPLIATCLVVGDGQKFCAALLFVEPSAVTGPSAVPDGAPLLGPELIDELKRVVTAANHDLPPWSTIKRFAVIIDELTMESGAVTPKMSIRRHTVLHRYDAVVQALYATTLPSGRDASVPSRGDMGAWFFEVAAAPDPLEGHPVA